MYIVQWENSFSYSTLKKRIYRFAKSRGDISEVWRIKCTPIWIHDCSILMSQQLKRYSQQNYVLISL